MTQRPVRQPTAEHPITVTPTDGHVVVRVNGEVVADTRSALSLQESTYPAVQYIPLDDVRRDVLVRSDTTTYCPYKGEAGYYSVDVGGAAVAGRGLVLRAALPGCCRHRRARRVLSGQGRRHRHPGPGLMPNASATSRVSPYSRSDVMRPSRVSKMNAIGVS